MSRAVSISTGKPYTLRRVCRVWEMARSTTYHQLGQPEKRQKQRPGPKGPYTDSALVEHIRAVIEESSFHGEGHRKVWARLRIKGVRTSRQRVLRLMRENKLLAPQRSSFHPGPKNHDGTIIPDNVHEMWGTDMTKAFTRKDGWASVFGAVDHFSAACVGVHGAKPGTRFEALEPVRQGVRENLGAFAEDAAIGITMRHDCGSQYVSEDFQDELKFLGFKASPAFVRSPECNGCIERFFRTLKENLLWVRDFEDIEDLNRALQEFKERYNGNWLIERHNHKTPNQVIERDLTSLAEAA
jgi:transposase InsO family protein